MLAIPTYESDAQRVRPYDGRFDLSGIVPNGGVVDARKIRRDTGAARDQRDREVIREIGVDQGRLSGHRFFKIHDRRERIVRHHDRIRLDAS